MLLKRQIGLVGATEVRVHYTFDGIARTVEGSVAKVSLMVMRAGGTWSSQDD